MKVVINRCYGGFGLSDEALSIYHIETNSDTHPYEIFRGDPVLVRIVEEMGSGSWSRFSELKVVEIPDGVEWTVQEHDGMEWIAEVHRTWS